MARTLVEAALTTATARARLGQATHWRALDPDVHLGYRKGARGGRWLVRWRNRGGRYRQTVIATADDALPADGGNVLSFSQAVTRARDLVVRHRADEAAAAAGPVLTVRAAVDEYVAERERNSEDRKRDARSRLTRHVLAAPLAEVALHTLTEGDLAVWRKALPATLATASVRRIVNDLKAALNAAARGYRNRLPAHLAVVIRNGLATAKASAPVAREAQVLADEEVRAVIRAAREIDAEDDWDGDLVRLILVLAATGARFSQVARMTVGDVVDGRLLVPTSRKGRGVKQRARIAVRVGRDVLAELAPVVTGRPSAAPLLERWRWRQISVTQWVKDRRGPWTAAAELTRPWGLIREKAELPAGTVAYSLRHSSIVRGLRAGLPIRHVAALHDTSSAMIETHYAAYIVDALDDLAAAAVVPLVAPPADVVTLRPKRGRRRS
ncbi:integrase [Rhodoplanes sp. SY1]|uniref:integrase n=1 Tax=Rhodoplanes sp. SY1 TaxID=3166646 RepID=UPI0038B51BAE